MHVLFSRGLGLSLKSDSIACRLPQIRCLKKLKQSFIIFLFLFSMPAVCAADMNHDLILAVINCNLQKVELLVKSGANVNARDRYGQTALMWAVIKGEDSIIRFLIQKGANINARDGEGNSVLMWAVVTENINTIRLLLDKGADVNVKDDSGATALMIAEKRKNNEIIQLLKSAGSKE